LAPQQDTRPKKDRDDKKPRTILVLGFSDYIDPSTSEGIKDFHALTDFVELIKRSNPGAQVYYYADFPNRSVLQGAFPDDLIEMMKRSDAIAFSLQGFFDVKEAYQLGEQRYVFKKFLAPNGQRIPITFIEFYVTLENFANKTYYYPYLYFGSDIRKGRYGRPLNSTQVFQQY
jgi:hypothetical protein